MQTLSFAQTWYWFLIGFLLSYLIGCFNFAVLISKIKKKDIRQIGSGNPGTMNMSRTFGLKIGIINFLCDALKGAVPVLCGYLIFRNYVFGETGVIVSDFARLLFGAGAIIGHIFPVTMKFKGGKGIASTFGLFWCALSCEVWWFFFIGFGVVLGIFFYIFAAEWGSMGSLLGVSVFTLWQGIIFFFRYESKLSCVWVILCFMLLLLLNLLTWIAHRKNLLRLMAGEEHRTSIKKMIEKKRAKKKNV